MDTESSTHNSALIKPGMNLSLNKSLETCCLPKISDALDTFHMSGAVIVSVTWSIEFNCMPSNVCGKT